MPGSNPPGNPATCEFEINSPTRRYDESHYHRDGAIPADIPVEDGGNMVPPSWHSENETLFPFRLYTKCSIRTCACA